MKLKKCPACKKYTLKSSCCSQPTKDAHYKFLKIKMSDERNTPYE